MKKSGAVQRAPEGNVLNLELDEYLHPNQYLTLPKNKNNRAPLSEACLFVHNVNAIFFSFSA